MGTQLSNLGVEIDSLASTDVPTGGTGKVLLYASGSGADSKLYVKAGADTQKLLGIDVESLTAKTGSLAQGDLFMVADIDGAEQNEQKLTFSDLEDAIFANVSGDARIAAGGALTIQAGTVENSMLADDAVDSDELAAGAVDLAHMSANSVDSDQYVDASIDTAHIGNDQITNALMADDAIDSDQLAAGAVDLAHMSANSVDSDQYVDGSIDLIHMSANSVDSDQYVDGSIDLVHMSANSVDSDQYVDGSIDLVHMSANSVDSDQYVDGSVDNVHMANSSLTVGSTSISLGGTSTTLAGLTSLDCTAANQAIYATAGANTITIGGAASTVACANDLTVAGDLTINGTTTTVNSTAVEIGDRIIELNTAGAAGDAGLYVQDVNSSNTGSLLWDTTANRWHGGVKDSEVNLVTISSTDTLTNKTLTSPDINGGTADSLTSLTIANNVDVGNFTVRAKGLLADDLTSTRVVFAGANGVLSDNTNMTFATDTLTVTKLGAYEQAGAVDFSDEAMTNVNIDSGAIDGTNITVGSGKTLDVSGGTLTLAANQISGDKVEGGTIAAITISALSAGTIAASSTAGFAGGYAGGGSGVSINSVGNLLSNGALTVDLSASFGGGYSDGGSGLSISSGGDLDLNGALTVGSSGEGADVILYGSSSVDGNSSFNWDASESRATFKDGGTLYLALGGESTDYGIDVGNGSAANSGNRGKIRAAAFVTYSDRNLKKDIAPMSDALNKVMALDAVSYKMKNDDRQEIGFIAQDVAKVVPEVCALDAQGVGRGIDYSRMTALLAGAMKSQQAQIENLQKVIANLQK